MSRKSAPAVHLGVDVVARLGARSDEELEAALVALVESGATLPAGLRALVDRPHLALEGGRPWKVFGIVLRTAKPGRLNAEELLTREPFVIWHRGRYLINTALPWRALVEGNDRLDRIEARLAELQAEQSAGLTLLNEAAGLFSSTLQTDDRLADPRKDLVEQHRLLVVATPLVATLRREIAATIDELEMETRRRRKPKDATFRVMWSKDLGPVFDGLTSLEGKL